MLCVRIPNKPETVNVADFSQERQNMCQVILQVWKRIITLKALQNLPLMCHKAPYHSFHFLHFFSLLSEQCRATSKAFSSVVSKDVVKRLSRRSFSTMSHVTKFHSGNGAETFGCDYAQFKAALCRSSFLSDLALLQHYRLFFFFFSNIQPVTCDM